MIVNKRAYRLLLQDCCMMMIGGQGSSQINETVVLVG